MLAYVRKLQVEVKTPLGKAGSPPHFFWGLLKIAFLSLAIHLPILERFYIAKWAIKEWRKKTLLVNFESCLKLFMDYIL